MSLFWHCPTEWWLFISGGLRDSLEGEKRFYSALYFLGFLSPIHAQSSSWNLRGNHGMMRRWIRGWINEQREVILFEFPQSRPNVRTWKQVVSLEVVLGSRNKWGKQIVGGRSWGLNPTDLGFLHKEEPIDHGSVGSHSQIRSQDIMKLFPSPIVWW